MHIPKTQIIGVIGDMDGIARELLAVSEGNTWVRPHQQVHGDKDVILSYLSYNQSSIYN